MKTLLASDLVGGILFDIQKERERQEELKRQGKFNWTCAAMLIPNPEKLAVLAEEFGEVAREVTEEIILKSKPTDIGYHTSLKHRLRKELIEVATVCVAWCEALDVELDDRKEFRSSFPSTEQASLSTNLADLTEKNTDWNPK